MQALQLPPLAEGETYIGAIGDQQGNLHHIIQLPGDNDDARWADQMAWAKEQGGDLPTRVELGLIWERNRDQMREDFYWTNELHHADSSYAWCQSFCYGYQTDGHKSAQLRAVAVRRLPI
ncbi:DUF1566 domain-containing protein [Castellaniella sp.]|uniref:DUF1566 domain-containing protein n=1 Tax=Castellaniella sp. TaxID=1955812 RepID=UPI003A8F6CAE